MKFDRKNHQTYRKKLIFYICFSYKKRIENIEKGKSYLKSNGFFKSKSNLFEDIQKFIYKR